MVKVSEKEIHYISDSIRENTDTLYSRVKKEKDDIKLY